MGDDGADEVSELVSNEVVKDVSKPVPVRMGSPCRSISPKYFSESFSADSWSTPANATTSRSGLKKISRYFSTTCLLMNCNCSWGHSRGFPRVLSLYAAM